MVQGRNLEREKELKSSQGSSQHIYLLALAAPAPEGAFL
jgi:hypothetical protein